MSDTLYPPPPTSAPAPPAPAPTSGTRSRGNSNPNRYNPAYQQPPPPTSQPTSMPASGTTTPQYNPQPPKPQFLTPQGSYYGSSQAVDMPAYSSRRRASSHPPRPNMAPPYPVDGPQDYAPAPWQPDYPPPAPQASHGDHQRRGSHVSNASDNTGRMGLKSVRRRSYLDPRPSKYEYYDEDEHESDDDEEEDARRAAARRRHSTGDDHHHRGRRHSHGNLKRVDTHRPTLGESVLSMFDVVKRAIVEPRDKY